jgi:methyl-accepting chemotaxis protein
MLRKLSIRIKLIAAFTLILALMASVSGVQMLIFSGYIHDYNNMLDGIAKANTINGMLKTDLDNEIREIVVGRLKFEDGKQYDMLKTMDLHLKDMKVIPEPLIRSNLWAPQWIQSENKWTS